MVKQLMLQQALTISTPCVVSFIGGGGKTSLILRLAEELSVNGFKTIITTTTKIYAPEKLPLLLAVDVERILKGVQEIFKEHNIAVLGSKLGPDGKVHGIDPNIVGHLCQELPAFVLVEADGAKGKSLKGYHNYEPLLPKATDLALAVIGADALGKKVDETCVHRADQFCAATGVCGGAVINPQVLAKSYRLLYEIGSGQTPTAVFIAIFNKVDLLARPETVSLELHNQLIKETGSYKRLLSTTTKDENPVPFIFQATANKPAVAVAVVVLAAGLSKRMGEDKLNLKFGDSPVFEATLKAILGADFDQVIVVTKPGSSTAAIAKSYNCQVVENRTPEQGLSSSLKAGLNAVSNSNQGVLFALADQPLIKPELYRLLITHYRTNLKLVTCPLYRGKRGNPTIFDRRTWPALQQVEGDHGGRSIIETLAADRADQIAFVTVNDPAVITDLDTPADYSRLLQKDSKKINS
jgi:probable selenium-dependent hydroxylase accessory protein YqeC